MIRKIIIFMYWATLSELMQIVYGSSQLPLKQQDDDALCVLSLLHCLAFFSFIVFVILRNL